jgi:uncharacterized protein (TIGR03437 family)
LTVTEVQPGIYTADFSGSGQGVVTNAITGDLIGPSNPAHAGDYLTVYCTGLGLLSGTNGEPEPGDGVAAPLTPLFQTTAIVTASLGGASAPVVFSGLTSSFAALYQVNLQVPAGVSAGNEIPLVLSVSDPQTGFVSRSNGVTVAIQ